MFRTFSLLIMLSIGIAPSVLAQQQKVKLAVIGLTHTHVHWVLSQKDNPYFELVGIVEPNQALATRYVNQHNIDPTLVYKTAEELLKNVKPDGVTAFGTIYEHLEVVETFAPLGIHVMVEKPLAVSNEHAEKMHALAKKYNIHLLTNYETTWYPSVQEAFSLAEGGKIGDVRKVIIRDGHKGPKKIGVNQEFLEWLTDPKLNGGGALTDFGCYGINLTLNLMQGKKPGSVTAITQQLQPENNPKVEDEATIILTYDNLQVIVQASWNWPIGRKDMEIYGTTGAIYADNRTDLRLLTSTGYDSYDEEVMDLEERQAPYNDPFVLFSAVIKREITLDNYDLSALENNLLVVEILQAAAKSADEKKTVFFE